MASASTKVVLWFWAVALLLGVPIWHKTTSVYRADLTVSVPDLPSTACIYGSNTTSDNHFEKIAHSLQIDNTQSQQFLQTQEAGLVEKIKFQLSRAAKTSPSYHLTFSLLTASGAPSSWDISQSIGQHLGPLLHNLRKTANIQVTTQVQLYSSYSSSIQAVRSEDGKASLLEQNVLPAFVNAAEWPLSPSIGQGPTLNFIIYVPSLDEIPLHVKDSRHDSWLVPQWGSISIVNPSLVPNPINGNPALPPHLTSSDLEQTFQSISNHLLSLLGVLDFTPSKQSLTDRLQTFHRIHATTLYSRAISSLNSLLSLSAHLKHIPIPRHVSELVESAQHNLREAASAFEQCDIEKANHASGLAYKTAEKAFFDKSMVAQVYFPDEHKVAVYMPLLGPVAVPLVMGLVRMRKGT